MISPWRKLWIRRDCDVPTFEGAILTAHKYIWPQTKRKKEFLFGASKGGHFHYFIHNLDEMAVGRRLYRRYFGKPTDVLAAYRQGFKFIKKTKAKTANFRQLLACGLSTKNLSQVLSEFERDFVFVNDNYSIMPWWALEAWQYDFNILLEKLIEKNHLARDREKILSSATKPWKPTAMVELRVAVEAKKKLEQLAKKYQFLRSWTVVWHQQIGVNWLRKLDKHRQTKTRLYSKTELFGILHPDKAQRKFFKAAPYIFFFKDWRDDLRRRHAFLWTFLWEDLGKFFGVRAFDLGYFSLPEIQGFLKKGALDGRLLLQRKTADFFAVMSPPRLAIKIISNKSAKKYKSVIQADTQGKKLDEIRGTVGQPGVARGRAKLVAGVADLAKVRKGDILVANTTHPNYIIAMQKAAAFVTDEGGLASHAAIVARELKIPCLVGAKIATKIFKDGDLVEVDANNGIVKKL